MKQLGWTTFTPVQELAIPALRSGRDLFAQAQTGTGKTGAFALPSSSASRDAPARRSRSSSYRRGSSASRSPARSRSSAASGTRASSRCTAASATARRRTPFVAARTSSLARPDVSRSGLAAHARPLAHQILVLDEADRLLDLGAHGRGAARAARAIADIIFRETTTIGLRHYEVDRECLRARDRHRRHAARRRCASRWPGATGASSTPSPEFDDCARARARRTTCRSRRSRRWRSRPMARRPRHRRAHREPLLHHDADLLHQRRAAPRPRLHDDGGRRDRARAPAAGRRRVLPDRHRRARPEGRAGGAEGRADRRRRSPTQVAAEVPRPAAGC